MKVVILAAGRSKRLKPLDDKIVLKFLGKPLISHQLEQLPSVGLDNFVIIGGVHNLDQIRSITATLPFDVRILEQKNLDDGMAGAIMTAEEFIQGEPMLVINGNDILDISAFQILSDALHSISNTEVEGFIFGKKISSYFPGGYLEIDEQNYLTGIIEKPGAGNEPSNLVNLVLHYFHNSSKFFEALRGAISSNDDRYEVALDHLIKNGVKLKVLPYDGFWQPLKYPWHVLAIMEHFLGHLNGPLYGERVEIAESAVIKGNVILEDGVKVMDQAVIIGPAYIGTGTIIASHTLVRNSQIGAHCVIGYATEVARSYIGDNVWTHSNYIGDSIISNNCSFGAGTVTGNLRLDEENIKIMIQDERVDSNRNKFGIIMGNNVRSGINTSFMPGVKIGNNCMIGAGVIVSQDIPDNKYVYVKTELIMKENKALLDEKKRDEMKKNLN